MSILEVCPLLNEKCHGNAHDDQPGGAGGSELPAGGGWLSSQLQPVLYDSSVLSTDWNTN